MTINGTMNQAAEEERIAKLEGKKQAGVKKAPALLAKRGEAARAAEEEAERLHAAHEERERKKREEEAARYAITICVHGCIDRIQIINCSIVFFVYS